MDVTRKQIEDEKDYHKLQEFGRTFEDEGFEVKLNAKTEELRTELLGILDEHFGKAEETADEVDEAKTELGAGDDEKQDEEEVPETTEEPKAEAAVEEAPEPEEKPKEELFVARRGIYRVWLGKEKFIVFEPTRPRTLPKRPSKRAAEALQNAIKLKRIIPFED